MWQGNKVVAWGTIAAAGKFSSYGSKYDAEGLDLTPLRNACDEADIVIGHNVKFDLLYIYRNTNNKLPRS